MRNLKKVLALTLAIALVLSLSVTAGAVKFTDKEDITDKYQDAVDLMSELNIMGGFPDGSYQPQGDLTRAQYLKMLYVVMNRGVDDKAVLYSDVQPFPFYDVRNYDWFNGYVKWGYGRQLIDGRGGGIFDPNGTVTGFEALKMSLTALGYSSEIEGYKGDAYKTEVLNDAQDAGLLLELETENLSVALSREAAAQLLSNTLFADMVRYNTSYIPAKMEKEGRTMASVYYSLSVLTGVAVANSWASVNGSSLQTAGYSTFDVRSVGNYALQANQTWGQLVLPFEVPLDLLGHEVILYAREKRAPVAGSFVGEYDKVYGSPIKTSRSKEEVKYARADVTTGLMNAATSGTLVNSGNTSLGYYVVDSDYGLDAAATVITSDTAAGGGNPYAYGTRVVNNYSYKAQNAAITLKKGSPIRFIDNNNDGRYDYVIATSMTYAKVTAINSDKKIVATSGDGSDFEGARALNVVAPADIYTKGVELKADDRILVYPIGSKYGADVVAASKGTLEASLKNGVVARISGKDYETSLLDSRVSSTEDILVASNYGVEHDYYYYAGRLVEGNEPGSASKKWALVLDSYRAGSQGFNTYEQKVKLLLADGTVASYNLGSIYKASDATATYSIAQVASPGWNTAISVDFNGDGSIARDEVLVGPNGYIFKATISEDDTKVDLYEQTTAPVSGASITGTQTYTNGATTLSTGAMNNKRVLDGSVFFAYKNSGSSNVPTDDLSAHSYCVYKGRDLATITAGQVTGVRYSEDDLSASYGSGKYVLSAALVGPTIRVDSVSNKKFAYVMDEPAVYNVSGKTSTYYAVMKLFDGSAVKEYTVKDGVRAKTTAPWNENLIVSAETGLTANTGSGVNNLGVRKGDIVEFSLSADGKISNLVKVPNLTTWQSVLQTAGQGNTYRGFYTLDDNGITRLHMEDDPLTSWILDFDDVKVYQIDTTVDTECKTLSAIPASNKNNAKKALAKTSGGKVTHMWIFPETTKDIKGLEVGLSTAGAHASNTLLTSETISTLPLSNPETVVLRDASTNNSVTDGLFVQMYYTVTPSSGTEGSPNYLLGSNSTTAVASVAAGSHNIPSLNAGETVKLYVKYYNTATISAATDTASKTFTFTMPTQQAVANAVKDLYEAGTVDAGNASGTLVWNYNNGGAVGVKTTMPLGVTTVTGLSDSGTTQTSYAIAIDKIAGVAPAGGTTSAAVGVPKTITANKGTNVANGDVVEFTITYGTATAKGVKTLGAQAMTIAQAVSLIAANATTTTGVDKLPFVATHTVGLASLPNLASYPGVVGTVQFKVVGTHTEWQNSATTYSNGTANYNVTGVTIAAGDVVQYRVRFVDTNTLQEYTSATFSINAKTEQEVADAIRDAYVAGTWALAHGDKTVNISAVTIQTATGLDGSTPDYTLQLDSITHTAGSVTLTLTGAGLAALTLEAEGTTASPIAVVQDNFASTDGAHVINFTITYGGATASGAKTAVTPA